MLTRISGGTSGIKEYLENGRKEGRQLSRDELDERVILAGDLNTTNQVILGMDTDGEKYLHITLAFREDEIDRATLEGIADDFRKFAFSAYEPDEYSFYAEAHMPKVKSYTDEKTGEFVERKPHIHIVVPKQNLLSGQHLNPFGVVDKNERFIDAFQEHVNNKYGLASPKESRRIEFTGASEMISRYKGDVFKGDKGKELKGQLLSEMLDRGIEDYGQFKKLAAEYGTVSTGKSKEREERYLKVTPSGATKAARLDSYVFSREFVELPTAEKHKRMAAEVQRNYQIAGEARRDPAHVAQQLDEWHRSRARELKYLNSGDKKSYQAYRQASTDTRQQMLAERESRFYTKHRKEQTNDQQDRQRTDRAAGADRFAREFPFKGVSPGRGRDAERAAGHHRGADGTRQLDDSRGARNRQFGPEPFGKGAPPQTLDSVRILSRLGVDGVTKGSEVLLPDHARYQLDQQRAEPADGLRRPADRNVAVKPTGRASDSAISQRSRDLQETKQARSAGRQGDMQDIKQNLDARRLLAELSQSHGVIPEKYEVTKAKDGGDRIKCGTRNLNVSDFLTKELNLSWKDAEKTLRESYGRQTGRQLQREHRQEPNRKLYAEFQAGRGDRQQLRTRQWDDQRTVQKERLAAIKKDFYAKRSRIQGDKSLTGAQRKAALSVARMERITSEAAAKERAGIEREQLKAAQRVPVMDQYRDFLAEKAEAGDEQALAELRRQKPEKTERVTENEAKIEGAEAPAKQECEPIHRTQALTYQVHRNGDVTYQRSGRDVLRDEGRSVQMLQTDDKTIETGLRLAQQKFGRKLALSGPPEFQEKAARVAAEAGLQVEFTDARLNRIMRERTAELAAEKARDQEARKLAQEFAKQQPAAKGKADSKDPAKGPQKAQEPAAVPTESKEPYTASGRYSGPVQAVDQNYVYQAHGRDTIRHERKHFSETPKPGDEVRVTYNRGQAAVKNLAQERAKSQNLDKGQGLG